MYVKYSKKQSNKQKRIELALSRADRTMKQLKKTAQKRGGKNVSQ
jgi:hypothetical protein